MIITIFGLPGSGKGTQSNLLTEKYSLKLVSVGDLLRNIISSNSKLAREVKSAIESGNLIRDEIVCKLLYEQLKSVDNNFLLDGFPRNLNQAHFLTQILQEKYNRDVSIAIELEINHRVAVDRLKNRLVCLDCKSIYSVSSFKKRDNLVCAKCNSTSLKRRIDDSSSSVINKRISEYYVQMKSLREYYKDRLLMVNANLDITQVKQDIENKISCNLV
ncbi:adenylate kinase [Wolbachia endosymbiont of Cruorifilaria tuberocauda]|uniref:adenylate kinase family protein n=1 Tax=Wolbachia endosymbiont of Cruorifilaria tuberocauda TaxID=1812111 RepID=UPI00158D295C|nr:nucleoside monophosphate kinase [Wolbachia endosymbiont of Cruorifilaria tuberocauda]QKX01606.1 adenylate kinase [Wolbachia endosymbiont of Cruorifilaria tuberocauda]